MTAEDYKRAAELLKDPDSEDNERFASWYGNHLLTVAQNASHAIRDLVALIESVAPEYLESTVVANARAALAEAER
jgi:hypothetical protein